MNGHRWRFVSRVLVAQRIISPECRKVAGVDSLTRSVRRRSAHSRNHSAEPAGDASRAQMVPKALPEPGGKKTLVPGTDIGQNRLAAVLGDDRFEPVADLFERLVPGDLLESTFALSPCASQRFQDSLGAVDTIQEGNDLRTQ